MNVLIVTNMYPTEQLSNYGVFVKRFTESIARLGIGVDVLLVDGKHSRLNYAKTLPKLRQSVLSGGYSLVHAHHSYCVIQIRLAGLLHHRQVPPLLFTIHEGETLLRHLPARKTIYDCLVMSKRVKRLAMSLCDYLVTVEARIPEAAGYSGSYEVIPPGVDADVFQPLEKRDCRRKLAISEDERMLLFPADPSRPLKGYQTFVQSLQYLGVPVTVVTGGEIRHENMPVFMGAADVVVSTSECEASPMVVKEAMLCNRPIVSTNVGDVEKVFGDTKGCFLCTSDPQDVAAKIRAALNCSSSMGRQRIMGLGLTIEATAQRYLQVYSRLC